MTRQPDGTVTIRFEVKGVSDKQLAMLAAVLDGLSEALAQPAIDAFEAGRAITMDTLAYWQADAAADMRCGIDEIQAVLGQREREGTQR